MRTLRIEATLDIEDDFYKSAYYLSKREFDRYIKEMDMKYIIDYVYYILVDNLEDWFEYNLKYEPR